MRPVYAACGRMGALASVLFRWFPLFLRPQAPGFFPIRPLPRPVLPGPGGAAWTGHRAGSTRVKSPASCGLAEDPRQGQDLQEAAEAMGVREALGDGGTGRRRWGQGRCCVPEPLAVRAFLTGGHYGPEVTSAQSLLTVHTLGGGNWIPKVMAVPKGHGSPR